MRFSSSIAELPCEQALPAWLSLSRSRKRKICHKSDIGSMFFRSCLHIRESLLYIHRETECIPEGFHKYRFPIVIATSISKKSFLSQIILFHLLRGSSQWSLLLCALHPLHIMRICESCFSTRSASTFVNAYCRSEAGFESGCIH